MSNCFQAHGRPAARAAVRQRRRGQLEAQAVIDVVLLSPSHLPPLAWSTPPRNPVCYNLFYNKSVVSPARVLLVLLVFVCVWAK